MFVMINARRRAKNIDEPRGCHRIGVDCNSKTNERSYFSAGAASKVLLEIQQHIDCVVVSIRPQQMSELIVVHRQVAKNIAVRFGKHS